ncbi:MAG: hypothetical protein PHW62_02110 [Candidatus Ratteibacteria bacterium]|nr:hypothetical protein [Candidatus Ratteibacteria bacterium]
MKNLVKNIILFFSFLFVPVNLILCQNVFNNIDWQFSIKWEDIPLSEIPLLDTNIQILDGRADVFFAFSKFELSDEVSLKAEGNITNGKILLNKWNEEISQLNGSFTIEDKKLNIAPLTGRMDAAPFAARAEMDLVPPYFFQANVNAESVLLEEISSFLPFLKDYTAFKLPAEAQFDIKGSLREGPLELTTIFQEVALYSVLLSNVEISFNWLDNKLILKNFYANLGEGRISGEGKLILNQKSSE